MRKKASLQKKDQHITGNFCWHCSLTTCLWSVRDPDLDRVPILWWRRSNSSPLSSEPEPWHLLLLRDLNPNIFLYLTGGALKGLTPVVHQSSWWQNTSMHKIIGPQSMIKCRPCQFTSPQTSSPFLQPSCPASPSSFDWQIYLQSMQ